MSITNVVGRPGKPWAPRNGLVGWWPLNDGSGTSAADRGSQGIAGTLYGYPEWIAGKFGGCLEFNGSSDYVKMLNVHGAGDLSAGTISMWVRTAASQVTNACVATVFYSGSKFIELYIPASGKMEFFGYSSATQWDILSDATVNDMVWRHVVGTWKNNEAKLYLNSVQQGATDSGCAISFSVADLTIGRYTTANYWAGQVDDLRLYNRALSAAEIAEMYQRSK